MTILEALKSGAERLQAVPDPRLDAEYLLAHVLNISRLSMLIDKSRALSDAEAVRYEDLLRRREGREPLQYILGIQPFMGLPFKTDVRALIPRNDTEALCEAALAEAQPGDAVLDLCTGSGALAIALRKLRPGLIVTATDLSGDALALARENARALNAQVRLLQGDLFAPVRGEVFDVIVSNPPYIPEALRGRLQPEVEQEPALALFAGEDGLDFYRRIAREAPGFLRAGGRLLLEIGDSQGTAVRRLLEEGFHGIRILNDLNGLPRVIRAERKPA